MNLYDKDGNPLRRSVGFRGGYVSDNPNRDEWVHGVTAPDRVRNVEDNWRPGGKEWEPLCRKGRARR